MQLNKSKPFGKIAGDTFIPEGGDRPAHFEQDGKFFDAHGKLIAGQAVAPVSTVDPENVEGEAVSDDDMPDMTVYDLLGQAETMNWRVFRQMAQKVLGPSCPSTKVAIIEALQAAQVEFDARAAKRAKERGQPVAQTGTHGIDLAAWARGAREYLWADIRKAIKTQYGRNVAERDDAVEFLISHEVVTAGEARRDVLREASA